MAALYTLYQAHSVLMAPARLASSATSGLVKRTPSVIRAGAAVRRLDAVSELVSGATLTHHRPSFGIDSVMVGGQPVQVLERTPVQTPFGSLVHFEKSESLGQPPLLLVAPLSGHFATMLTGTIRALLTDHDVYVTDWHNARDVETIHGQFGMDDYVQHIIDFLHYVGPGTHVMAVCQPCVPAVVATAVLAQDDDPDQPLTLTLMSGPIDPRANPTKINKLADKRPLDWYKKHVITTVPRQYAGAGRRVYPGFLQVGAFMSMNLKRHLGSQVGIYKNLVAGENGQAQTTQDFYREYFAVLDIPAEFYLDSVRTVFMDQLLPRGKMTFYGRPVTPSAITRTALLTIEAERDDMCGPGQTEAAHALFASLTDDQRAHHLQPGVGHYGIFAGRRWQMEVYPVVRDFIRDHS